MSRQQHGTGNCTIENLNQTWPAKSVVQGNFHLSGLHKTLTYFEEISSNFFCTQVALFQLNDVTLMISVYAKRNMKRNEMVGWFSLGLNSSGPEEAQHFNDMRDAANINGQVGKCDLIARWHVLVVSFDQFRANRIVVINIFRSPRIPDSTSRDCPRGATV